MFTTVVMDRPCDFQNKCQKIPHNAICIVLFFMWIINVWFYNCHVNDLLFSLGILYFVCKKKRALTAG